MIGVTYPAPGPRNTHTVDEVGAAADCELIGPGILGQPVNSLTAFAFVIAGALILTRRPERGWIGVAAIATGIGSFLFHGPMPPGAEWAHDVTLAWLLLVVAVDARPDRSRWALIGLAVLGALFAAVPAVADPVAVVLAAIAIASVLRQDRSTVTVGALSLLTVSAVVGRLGATGGPLCNPESVLQPHGLWHVSAAVAIAWWALASNRVS